MSYYRGAQPDVFRSGSPWPDANFEIVRQTTEIFPGFFVLTTVSQKPDTRDMNEVSLAIRTPEATRRRCGMLASRRRENP